MQNPVKCKRTRLAVSEQEQQQLGGKHITTTTTTTSSNAVSCSVRRNYSSGRKYHMLRQNIQQLIESFSDSSWAQQDETREFFKRLSQLSNRRIQDATKCRPILQKLQRRIIMKTRIRKIKLRKTKTFERVLKLYLLSEKPDASTFSRRIERWLMTTKNIRDFTIQGQLAKKETVKAKWDRIALNRCLVQNVMCNHLLAGYIFQYLDVPDLLNCGLVAKTWQENSRRVLRRDKVCLAVVSVIKFCRRFQDFCQLMEESKIIPFNGLSLYYSCHSCNRDCTSDSKAVDSLLKIPNFTIKYLKSNYWHADQPGCPIGDLMTRLTLNVEKILGPIEANLAGAVVTNNKVNSVDGLLLNSPCYQEEDMEQILRFAQAKPTLKSLDVGHTRSAFLPLTIMTLRNLYWYSQNSLTVLNIDQVDLLMFINQHMATLPCLKEMCINLDSRIDESLGFYSLTRVDFPTKFPNLQLVIVDPSQPQRRTFNGDDEDFFLGERGDLHQYEHRQEFFATSVTKLKLVDSYQNYFVFNQILHSFSRLFPAVLHLQICLSVNFSDYIRRLWITWPKIESITITDIRDTYGNVDSAFTGISEKNCQMLLNYQKKSGVDHNLLQLYASITNLDRLKLLRLHFRCHVACETTFLQVQSVLTQVTGQYAFALMQGVVIEIIRNQCRSYEGHVIKRCCVSMEGLSPYVSFLDGVGVNGDAPRDWNLEVDT